MNNGQINPVWSALQRPAREGWSEIAQYVVYGVLLLMATLLMAACGGSDDPPPAPPAAPSPTGVATIGTAGGTVSGAAGATVTVPPGAMATEVTIRIANDSTGSPPVPAGLAASGSMVAITPHGAEFAEPVEVRVPVPNVTLQPNQELTMAKAQPGGEWEVLSGVTRDGGVLTARVNSFSYFLPVVVTYPVALVSQAPLEVTTSLACEGQDCNNAIGRVNFTYTIQTNNGQAPTDCTNPALRAVLSAYPYGNSSSDTTLGVYPLTGGVAAAGAQPPYSLGDNRKYVRIHLRCGTWWRDYGSNSKSIWWSTRNLYPSLLLLRAPAQVDVVSGLPAAIEVILSGGASSQSTNGSAIPPTPTNRAVIDWQRSDDQGASWRNVAQSYEDEANPAPAGSRPLWRVWSVRHSFVAGAVDQGALIRARACYTPPDAAPPPCVTSAPTRITVLQQSALPQISDAPRPVLIRTGQTASFSAAASGLPAPTLQWQTRAANSTGAWSDVTAGNGATSGSYTTEPLALADNGRQYRVLATNALGSAAGAPVTVSVSDLDVAPSITAQPASLSVVAGSEAVFAVVARGTEALSYQWQFNGVPIAGANSPVLRLPAVTGAQAGAYQAQISNVAGSVVSSSATLTVSSGVPAAVAPTIVTQPAAVTVNEGNTATFAVGVSGSGPFTFQWFRGGTAIAGANSAAYTIASVRPQDAASYGVVVRNAVGEATSSEASLTVVAAPASVAPSIVTPPATVVVAPGGSATLAVAASGSGPLNYQWQRDGSAVPGATGPVLGLASVTSLDAGSYTVTVSNSAGSITSAAAQVIVLGAPTITASPSAATVTAGATATFAVNATGNQLRYQWTRNNIAIPGADAASYTTPALTLADSGAVYGVIVYNGAGLVISQGAVLTVNPAPMAPTVTQQPADRTVVAGTQQQVSAAFGGVAPFTVQVEQWIGAAWQAIGSVVTVPDNDPRPLLTLAPGPADVGAQWQFRFVATNAAGTVATNTFTATIVAAPGMAIYAGNFVSGGGGGAADGTGTAARFDTPEGLVADAAGNLYVAQSNNARVARIASGAVVTTILSPGYMAGTNFGALALGPDGTLYAAGISWCGLYRVTTPAGATPTWQSMTLTGCTGSQTRGVAVDANGVVHLPFNDANAVIRIGAQQPDGTYPGSVFVGAASVYELPGSVDCAGGELGCTGLNARFSGPRGIAFGPDSHLYVADSNNHTIRRVSATGYVTTFAGSAGQAGTVDGTGSAARFNRPSALSFDPDGNLVVLELGAEFNPNSPPNAIVRRISPAGVVTTLFNARDEAVALATGGEAPFAANVRGLAVLDRKRIAITAGNAVLVRTLP